MTDKELKAFADTYPEELEALRLPHIFGQMLGFTKLGDIHSTWINRWVNCDEDNSLQAHRNSFKTSCIAVTVVLLLLLNPNLSILIMRKDHTSATQLVDQIRKLLESDEALYFFDAFYGAPVLRTDNWSRHSLTIALREDHSSKEGSVEAGGLEVKTGQHYDIIFADDIITRRDRYSRAEREKTKTAVYELQNIKKPGGRIIFTGTVWHKEDAWSVVPVALRYPIGTIEIEGMTEEVIANLKKSMVPSLFAANYELENRADESLLFSEPLFAPMPIDKSKPIFVLDQSYSGKAMTACVGVYLDPLTGRVHAVGRVWPDSVAVLFDKVIRFVESHNGRELNIESNPDKGLSHKAIKDRNPSFRVKSFHTSENKHAKISVNLRENWDNLYFDEKGFEAAAMDQVCEYAEGVEPCDVPDALATALAILMGKRLGREKKFGGREVA